MFEEFIPHLSICSPLNTLVSADESCISVQRWMSGSMEKGLGHWYVTRLLTLSTSVHQ